MKNLYSYILFALIFTFLGVQNSFAQDSNAITELRQKLKDAKDDNIFTFIEEWENAEIIKSHNASKHFTSIVPKFADLIAKQSEINLYKKVK